MVFENDFLDMMPHSVVVASASSMNSYGKLSHSATNSTYSALVQYEQKLIRAMDGTEKISMAQVIMASTKFISPNDKITLPDGTKRPIFKIDTLADDEGQHHIEIYFG